MPHAALCSIAAWASLLCLQQVWHTGLSSGIEPSPMPGVCQQRGRDGMPQLPHTESGSAAGAGADPLAGLPPLCSALLEVAAGLEPSTAVDAGTGAAHTRGKNSGGRRNVALHGGRGREQAAAPGSYAASRHLLLESVLQMTASPDCGRPSQPETVALSLEALASCVQARQCCLKRPLCT